VVTLNAREHKCPGRAFTGSSGFENDGGPPARHPGTQNPAADLHELTVWPLHSAHSSSEIGLPSSVRTWISTELILECGRQLGNRGWQSREWLRVIKNRPVLIEV
jgi:hypothetical protein